MKLMNYVLSMLAVAMLLLGGAVAISTSPANAGCMNCGASMGLSNFTLDFGTGVGGMANSTWKGGVGKANAWQSGDTGIDGGFGVAGNLCGPKCQDGDFSVSGWLTQNAGSAAEASGKKASVFGEAATAGNFHFSFEKE